MHLSVSLAHTCNKKVSDTTFNFLSLCICISIVKFISIVIWKFFYSWGLRKYMIRRDGKFLTTHINVQVIEACFAGSGSDWINKSQVFYERDDRRILCIERHVLGSNQSIRRCQQSFLCSCSNAWHTCQSLGSLGRLPGKYLHSWEVSNSFFFVFLWWSYALRMLFFWIFITFLRKPAFSEVFPYFEGRSLQVFIICYLFSETSNKASMHSPATCMLVDIRMRASHANIWQRYCGF